MSQSLKNISNAKCLSDRAALVIFPLFSCYYMEANLNLFAASEVSADIRIKPWSLGN